MSDLWAKKVYNDTGERLLRRELVEPPLCGEAFCDICGDCLHCYGDLPCYDGGIHVWIEYEAA